MDRSGTDRAVSDVVGYILVFSLIVVMIGTVFTFGFTGLADRQSAEQVNNVERAMDVFAHNMEDVWAGESPSRATEIRLAGGTLRFEEPIEITVERDDRSVTAFTRPVVYEREGTEIVYSGGALLRSGGDNAVMLTEPPFVVRSDRLLVPLVEVSRPSDQRSISADGTVRLSSTARSINGTVPGTLDEEGTGNVTVTVNSTRADAWERYFAGKESVVATEVTGDTMEATVDVQAASAPRFRIRVRFVE